MTDRDAAGAVRPAEHDSETPSGPAWWLGLIAGGSILAFGVYGLLGNSSQTLPIEWGTWVAGALIAHDAILVPVVLLVGSLLTRLLPAAIRGGIQATLVVGAVVALMSVPVLKAAGRRPDNPSLLPHDYAANLAIVLAVILVTGVLLTLAAARRR